MLSTTATTIRMNLRREFNATVLIYAIQLTASIAAGCAVGGALLSVAFYLLAGLGMAVYQAFHYLEKAAQMQFQILLIAGAVVGAVSYALTDGAGLIADYKYVKKKHESDQSQT